MIDLRARLGLEYPILQAGMAGGLSGSELAGAVSKAGGLGTVGLLGARRLTEAVRGARGIAPGRPVAVNLLMPFTRSAHIDVCVNEKVDAVVLFCGTSPRAVKRLRGSGVFVFHQVGTHDQARQALADGADALIVQGREAGGHLLGVESALDTLARVRAVADGVPVLVAGGIADAEDVRRAMRAGASGVVCGSRFLLTEESGAHSTYKTRVLGATRTIETTLFGLGWPLRHRVVANAATDRWCGENGLAHPLARLAGRLSAPLARVAGMRSRPRSVPRMALRLPLLLPLAPRRGDEGGVVEVSPLYAGESVARIRQIVSAEQAVRDLALGLSTAGT